MFQEENGGVITCGNLRRKRFSGVVREASTGTAGLEGVIESQEMSI